MYRQRVSVCNPKKPSVVEDQKKLSDALKVNKLCNNELRVYFPGIKVSPDARRQEYLRQTQHYEGFKKAFNSKKVDNEGETEETTSELITAYNMKDFLKRYGLRKKQDVQEKTNQPAMRRTPLRSMKTVNIELPGLYATEAILSAPKTSKPINKSQDKFASKLSMGKEEKEKEQDPHATIEKQLEQTKNEISIASTQLEQIKELLKQRKLTLTPVLEEAEEVWEKKPRVVQTVDRKCSAMKPQTQWMVKSVNTDNPPSKNKNRLMLTLNNLNQRLQKIQEKYFNAPRIKYKSIYDIPSDVSHLKDVSLQTIYRNSQYEKNASLETGMLLSKEKTTETDLFNPPKKSPVRIQSSPIRREELRVDTSSASEFGNVHPPSIEVLFSPQRKILDSADEIVFPEVKLESSKSILKKQSKFDDYVIEAPALQESIFKSNYLMKEFNVNSRDFNIDLGKLLESNKKNVRFGQTNLYRSEEESRGAGCSKTQKMISTLDFAMKNSLFYPEA